MKKINKIDPSIAFCATSAAAKYNHYFDNKAIIYRKLINSFSHDIEKDCFIAIDTSLQPEQGDLTLLEFGTDSERLIEFDGQTGAFGKVCAYSAVNDFAHFYTLQPAKTNEQQLNTSLAHLKEISPNDIQRFSETLTTLLDSHLLKPDLYDNVSQLLGSLETFASLLNQSEAPKSKDAAAIKYLPITPDLENIIDRLDARGTLKFFRILMKKNHTPKQVRLLDHANAIVGMVSSIQLVNGGQINE